MALVASGGSNYLAGTSNLGAVTGDKTIAYWVKFESPTADAEISRSQFGNKSLYVCVNGNGDIVVTVYNNAVASPFPAQSYAGGWIHVAVVQENALSTEKTKLYLNGAKVATQEFNNSLSMDAPIRLGSFDAGGHTHSVADLAYWNVALSASQVANLAGCVQRPSDLPTGLVGYWTLLDQTTGAVTNGDSGLADTVASNDFTVSSGALSWSSDTPISLPPVVGGTAAIDSVTDSSVTVSISGHSGPGTLHLQLYRNGQAVSGATSSPYVDTNLDSFTEYTYYWLVSDDYTQSDQSSSAVGKTEDSWTAASESNVAANSSTITGLSPSTAYDLRVVYTDDNETVYSETETAQTGTPTAPTVTTGSVSSITTTTATVSGEVTSDGGSTLISRGFVIGTSLNPSIGDPNVRTYTELTDETGAFNWLVTELEPGTTYYVRAYAINSEGTSYGDSVSFETEDAPVVTITSPSDGSMFDAGTEVTFTATAIDSIDGDISDQIVWLWRGSQVAVGTSWSFVYNGPAYEASIVTARATDSAGQSAEDSISILIDTSSGSYLSIATVGTSGTHGPNYKPGVVGATGTHGPRRR
jgi:hypothetical protein